MTEVPSISSRISFFQDWVCSKRTFRLYQCTFVMIFFLSKGIIPWSANHLSTAGTHAASQIFRSHIFLNYPSLLCSSMCTRKKVALQTNLIWTFLTYWKLLKQLLPIKRISRVLYSEKDWRRELRWWLIDLLLSEHWNPSSVGDEPHPSWTSNFKCVCMKQVSQNGFAFPGGSKVSKYFIFSLGCL